MNKCLNCDLPADYVVRNPGSAEQTFCKEDLPVFYKENDFNTIVFCYVEEKVEDPAEKAKRIAKKAEGKPTE